MTTYTTLLLCEKLDLDTYETLVSVPANGAGINGTTAHLKTGDVLSINDLLYGVMLPSGNDAAYTLAHFMGETLVKKGY